MCDIDYTLSVCGDFNLPEYDRSACCNPSSMPAPEALFANYVTESGLTQLVSEPTRGNNILDLLLVNDPQAVFYATVTVPFSTSDHNAIQWSNMLPISAHDNNFDNYNNVNMYDFKTANSIMTLCCIIWAA